MTFDTIPQQLMPKLLSARVRYMAGALGGLFVAGFMHEAVRHPADGWWSAIVCGLPMVWLIQGARTGSSQNWRSLVWYAVWYVIFASGWLIALAIESPAPGRGLHGEAAIGVFLGSIALVGGASSLAHWREAAPARRRGRPIQSRAVVGP